MIMDHRQLAVSKVENAPLSGMTAICSSVPVELNMPRVSDLGGFWGPGHHPFALT
jgi:hypothetical protein